MDKFKIRKLFVVLAILIITLGCLSLVVGAGFVEPGSEEDPIITLSYVEKRLEQIKFYIDQNLEELNKSNSDITNLINNLSTRVDQLSNAGGVPIQGSSNNSSFQVVFVEKGKFVYFGEGTELILRSGKATAIISENGGLSNVTSGKDLKMGEELPLNNLIIIPRNDGRGANVLTDSYFMIKGPYTIQ